tara:strand:+ start:233 stop:856 length:624 start_codon:yes stop_codon:yes gene_type:complete
VKRTNSQNIWLKRQKKDVFVKLSKARGYRSRAAYKLIEINKKFKIINQNSKVVDLGASPGGWTQVVAELQNKKNQIIAIDKKQMEPIESCKFIYDDISNLLKNDETLESNSFDVILSDMAANSSGHRFTDQANAEKIYYLAQKFALKYLKKNGNFVCKFFRNSLEKTILQNIKQKFSLVKIYKPNSSRKDSKEIYLIAIGFNNLHKD